MKGISHAHAHKCMLSCHTHLIHLMLEKMSSELASLFSRCEAAVPQFEVIEKRPIQSQATEEAVDTAETAEKLTTSPGEKKQAQRRKPRGRTSSRDPRDSRTVFVGNIPNTCSRKQIHRLFKTYGKIESVRVRCLQVKEGKLPKKIAVRRHKQLTDDGTFNAYVVFASEEEAEASLKLNGMHFGGRHIRVDLVVKKELAKMEESRASVFVGNLPFTADEEKLRDCFSDCGCVESVRIVRDSKTGIGKGFGFVSFSDKSGVMFAVRQSKKIELDGRKLRVFKSKDEQTLKLQKQAKFSGIRTEKGAGKKSFGRQPKQSHGTIGSRTGAAGGVRKRSAFRQRTSRGNLQRQMPSKSSM